MQKSHEKAYGYWITYLYICKPAKLFKYITDICVGADFVFTKVCIN